MANFLRAVRSDMLRYLGYGFSAYCAVDLIQLHLAGTTVSEHVGEDDHRIDLGSGLPDRQCIQPFLLR